MKYVRCTVPDRDSRIRSEMSSNSTHTKIRTLKQLPHCNQRLNREDIFMLLNTLSRNKRRKNC